MAPAQEKQSFLSGIIASIPESVGVFVLRSSAEIVVEGVFGRVSASGANGSAGRQFHLQIHSLDRTRRNLALRLEPVEDRFGIILQGPSPLLHRANPVTEEASDPSGAVLHQKALHPPEVVWEKFVQAEHLSMPGCENKT